jgi:hypothetical protein
MPIEIYPRKLSYTNRSSHHSWTEKRPIIPVITFPFREKSIEKKGLIGVINKIVIANNIFI